MSTIEKIDSRNFIIKFWDEPTKESPVLPAIGCLWYVNIFNDNNFIINYVDKVNTTSNTVDHMACKWSITNTIDEDKEVITIKLNCNSIESSLWNLRGTVTMTPNGKGEHSKTQDFVFHSKNTTNDGVEFSPRTLFRRSNKIAVECLVWVESVVGLVHKVYDFTKMDENVNNIALVVEGKKLYVSKQILAMASPVFHAMFYSGFKESTADEISIQDVKYEDFEQFLQLIYGGTTDIPNDCDYIENLLKLADRFNVDSVMKKCEDFLITSTIHVVDKFELCYLFDLTEAQVAIVGSLNADDLKECLKHNDRIDESTLRLLCQKLAK